MNAEKILTWSVAALGHLKNGANGNAAEILEYLRTEAEAEIRHAAAKQSGNGNRQKAAERVIKSAKADNPREAFWGSWNDARGHQFICDGFRLIEFFEPLPLEKIREGVQPIDAARVMPPDKNARGAVLELPTVAELKAYIKEEKALKKAVKDKSGVLYDFGAELPAVNAQFLFDMLEALPGCVARASSARPLLNALYFECSDGCGILLPVRKKEV